MKTHPESELYRWQVVCWSFDGSGGAVGSKCGTPCEFDMKKDAMRHVHRWLSRHPNFSVTIGRVKVAA
jgi:hypothetical protein